jgi:hypothetical protein
MIEVPRNIKVSPDVKDIIVKAETDFRLRTTCGGPVIVPIAYSPKKESDIKIPIGNNVLYVSKVQAKYLREISMRMIEGYLMSLSK